MNRAVKQLPPPPTQPRFITEWLMLALALGCLGSYIAFALSIDHGRIGAAQRERLMDQAEIVEKNLVQQLRSAHRAMESIVGDLAGRPLKRDGLEPMDKQLKLVSDTLGGVRTLFVVNAQGRVVSSNREELIGLDLSKREYFRLARDTPSPKTLYVTPPYRTVLNSYLINLVRMVPGPKGEFAGIVVAGADPDFFRTLLDSVRATPDTLSGIFHGDGKVFVLFPEREGAIGFDASKPGSFFTRHLEGGASASLLHGTFYVTGEERVMAMRTIQPDNLSMDKPLIVTVSRHVPEIFAPWRRDVWSQGGLFCVLVLSSTFGLFYLQRRQRIFMREYERQLLENRLAEEALNLMAKSFTHSGEGMVITDAEANIIRVNNAFTRLTGYGAGEVLGKNPKILSAGMTPASVYETMWASLTTRGVWEGELWDRRKTGEVYPKWLSITAIRSRSGELTHYLGSFSDISERRKSEAKIRHLAHHDALTQLPNRLMLHEQLARVIQSARDGGGRAAVMLIDLDRFKAINDTMGHHVGDQLLVEVASRLVQSVREHDIVARLGGDEFVVVLPEIETADDAAVVAYKITLAISAPYQLANKALHTSPSIGISLYPDHATESDDLIRFADVAMYHAKGEGRSNHQFFSPEMSIAAASRLSLEADLRNAIEQQQFVLHYQPQIDLRTGKIFGVEALIRWQHHTRGLVPPMEFIPIAEETGMIGAIGDWVLEEGLRQLSAWREVGLADLRLSLNLSASQFRNEQLPGRINRLLRDFAIEAGSLDLEITESMAMDSPDETIAMQQVFAERGLHLSIDDFGTGYSSLAYLKLFPIHTLKIDRSFVKDIESDPDDAEICDVIVLLAHKLGLEVIAEGVETEAQLTFLTSIGCEKIQGYLLSRPLPGEEVAKFIFGYVPRVCEARIEDWSTVE